MGSSAPSPKSSLMCCCGAHLVQDGLVALQFVLLPIIAQALGLTYSQVGLLKAVSNISMSALEIPSGVLAEKFGERRLIVFGLATAGIGYSGVALSSGFLTLALFFLLAGVGAAFQHSLSSAVLANTFGETDRRKALGTYNSSGDAGKLLFTGVFSLGVGMGLSWNALVIGLSLLAIIFGFVVYQLLHNPNEVVAPLHPNASLKHTPPSSEPVFTRWGISSPRRFTLLGLSVFLDSMAQAIFLTFIAFILLERGVSDGMATAAVVIALTGGMVGKFCCGYLATHLGDRQAYTLVQLLTLIALAGVIYLPVGLIMLALPFIGLVMQGSSTITYGAVTEFITADKQSRGYSLIYTFANAASVVGPFTFGVTADQMGLSAALLILTCVVALSIPCGLVLNSIPAARREQSLSGKGS